MGYREKSASLDHSVTCIYNEDNQVSSVTEVINGVTTTYSYTYDEDNRVTNVAIGNLTVSYTYDGFGRLESRTVKNGDTVIQNTAPTYSAGKEANTTTGQISQYNGYTYTYDKNGNILSVTDGTYTTSYEYDSANQLIRENNQQLNFTHTWTYDNAGNILSRSEYPYTVGALGIPTDTVEYSYLSSASWGDMIDSYGANDYLPHDGAGNLRYDGKWTYSWQHGRELTSMTKDNTTWTFSYDANGMRTGRTDGLTTYTYVYSGSQLVEMYFDGQDELRFNFTYDTSGIPVSVTVDGSSIYYYVTNLQGDVVGLLNENGQQVATYLYDAWGNVTSQGAEPIEIYNPLLYRGYVYDWETGLYYLQSRYYNPEWGRFINADGYNSTGQGFLGNNMFAYCGNNPANRMDPTGEIYVCDERSLISSYGGAGFFSFSVTSIGTSPTVLTIGATMVGAPLASLLSDILFSDDNSTDLFQEDVVQAEQRPNKSENENGDVYFPADPFQFKPSGLVMHICVEIGTGTNGGIIKWEIPGTGIAIFEWDEDYEKGTHYHCMTAQDNNKHQGDHHKIGTKVPEPWKSIFF